MAGTAPVVRCMRGMNINFQHRQGCASFDRGPHRARGPPDGGSGGRGGDVVLVGAPVGSASLMVRGTATGSSWFIRLMMIGNRALLQLQVVVLGSMVVVGGRAEERVL